MRRRGRGKREERERWKSRLVEKGEERKGRRRSEEERRMINFNQVKQNIGCPLKNTSKLLVSFILVLVIFTYISIMILIYLFMFVLFLFISFLHFISFHLFSLYF